MAIWKQEEGLELMPTEAQRLIWDPEKYAQVSQTKVGYAGNGKWIDATLADGRIVLQWQRTSKI